MLTDKRLEMLQEVHEAYIRGSLRLLVGAGISISSGFPDWDKLMIRLLQEHLRLQSNPAKPYITREIEDLAQRLYNTLGREGAADYVRTATLASVTSDTKFESVVAPCLYNGRDVDALPLTEVHRQIARMTQLDALCTTNLDPLLELALEECDHGEQKWTEYRLDPYRSTADLKRKVLHVHGWIDPNGHYRPPVILAESQYIELGAKHDAPANLCLKRIFEGGSTLIIGMSLTDANLRRFIYLLKRGGIEGGKIVAVIREPDPVLRQYIEKRQGTPDFDFIFINDHSEIETVLRLVRYGVPTSERDWPWVQHILRETPNPTSQIFDPVEQKRRYKVLRSYNQHLRYLFAIPSEEALYASLFVPSPAADGSCRLVMAGASWRPLNSVKETKRALKVSPGAEQSVIGAAFTTGHPRDVLDDGPGIYINMNRSERDQWKRDWRSILAIPILEAKTRLPVAVMAITSNFARPFWRDFNDRYDLRFSELLEQTNLATQRIFNSMTRTRTA